MSSLIKKNKTADITEDGERLHWVIISIWGWIWWGKKEGKGGGGKRLFPCLVG